MVQDVFIIGAKGKVGRTLVRQILEKDTSRAHKNPTRIVGLADMGQCAYLPAGLQAEAIDDFLAGRPYPVQNDGSFEKIAKTRTKKAVFVDVTATKQMAGFHSTVMQETNHGIVTANKKPLVVCDFAMFQRLTRNPRRYGYRCSVMAGAEAINFLQDLRDVGDVPKTIEGCFSGTLGYIASAICRGRRLSDAIHEAYEQGYTEPHPKDDLSGVDVARKLVILARTSGHAVSIDDVRVAPLVPEEYLREADVGRFLEAVGALDNYFAERADAAKARGCVLRYVAHMDAAHALKCRVGLEEVPADSPLGRLDGTLNKIVVVSKAYPAERPYSVEAPGAGLDITAQNIRRDLLYQLDNRQVCYCDATPPRIR